MLLRNVACSLALLLVGCASSTAHDSGAHDYTLRPGKRITLSDDAALTYVGVIQDSRCPPKVQCIHAGSAEVRLHLAAAGGEHDVTLRTDDPTTTIEGRRLQLLDLAFGDAPALTVRVDATH